MYKHREKTGEHISLHDCKADRIKFKNGNLTFYFGEGFFVLPSHKENNTGKAVRTDAAKVKFHLEFEEKYDFDFYVFRRKRGRRKGTCTEMKHKKFIKRVNSGRYRPEFLYVYETVYNDNKLIDCVLWDTKKGHQSCVLKIDADSVTYCWNELREAEWQYITE